MYFQVIHRRNVRQLATGCKIMPEEWNASTNSLSDKNADSFRAIRLTDIRQCIRWQQRRINRIVLEWEASGRSFTTDDLINGYQNRPVGMSLFEYMERQITRLIEHKQYRTAETYRSTLNSFCRFRKETDIALDKLDADLLKDYEGYLKDRRLTPNTRSFYMKRLRAVYNKAVEEGWTDDHHPFRKVSTTSEKTAKRAIPLNIIRRLKELDLSDSPSLRFARDIFLFSFYTRGMSFVDIAHLQKTNLKDGRLSYRRKKTGQLLTLHWETCMDEITGRYAVPRSSPYLLPIIKDTKADSRKQYKCALTFINRKLKEIGHRLELSRPLTLYVARHSWASIAHHEGIPLSVISEGMGHDSEKTTRIYLASLETQVIDNANKKILGML